MSAEPKTELRAAFHQMKNGTKEDWQIIGSHHAELCNGVADRVLAHLRLLDGDYGGIAVDRLTHRRQTATLATRGARNTSSPHSSTTSATPSRPTTTRRSAPRS